MEVNWRKKPHLGREMPLSSSTTLDLPALCPPMTAIPGRSSHLPCLVHLVQGVCHAAGRALSSAPADCAVEPLPFLPAAAGDDATEEAPSSFALISAYRNIMFSLG